MLAELLELAPGGVEESERRRRRRVRRLRRAGRAARAARPARGRRRGAGRGHHERGARRLGRALEGLPPARCRSATLLVRPPWEPPRAGLLDVVIDPAQAFGTGAHPTTRLCLELLLELEPAGRARRRRLRLGRAGHRRGAAGVGAGARHRPRARVGAGDARQRAPPTASAVQARRHDLLRDGPGPGAPTVLANLLRPLLLRVAQDGFAGAAARRADRQRAARPRGRRGRRRLRPPRPARDRAPPRRRVGRAAAAA